MNSNMGIKKSGYWRHRFLFRVVSIVCVLFLISCSSSSVRIQTVPGAIVINGQKTLPMGWYAMHEDLALEIPWFSLTPLDESVQHGFDYVMPYYISSQGEVGLFAYLDAAQDRGAKVMIDMHPVPASAKGLEQLTTLANMVKNHPAVYGYYLDDEPEIRDIPASEVIAKYNVVKAVDSDPNHIVLLVLSKPVSKHADYLPGCDVVGRELYALDRYSDVAAGVAAAKNAGKGYLAIPDLYQYRGHLLSTPERFRYMVFAPISVGADGIMPFIFEGSIPGSVSVPAPGFRDTIVYPSTNQLRLITPTLLKGTVGLSSSCGNTYGDDITWIFAGDANDAVLIAVNNNQKLLRSRVKFTLKGMNPSIGTAAVLGESRTVTLTNGSFIDSFAPLEVHIYVMPETKGGTLTIFPKDDKVAVNARPVNAGAAPAEIKVARDWVSAHFGQVKPVFSFIYNGQSSLDFLKTWKIEQTSIAIDDKRTEHMVTYADPCTGLTVRSVAMEYHDFPIIEWTLYFKNTGDLDTPILENIKALDIQIARKDLEKDSSPQNAKEKSLLHFNIGSPATIEDYRPMVKELTSGNKECVATSGGRPSNKHMPYFNLEWSGCGLIMAVGWPGQWAAEFERTGTDELHLSAGQETTHFKLHPGEEVRSPLIALQFYRGDWIRAQNIWRRWIIAHNMPRPGGVLPVPQVAGMAFTYFSPWGISNSLAMEVFIDWYEHRKIPIDAWWIDAGWYVCNFPQTDNDDPEQKYATGMGPGEPSWPNVGTWEADPYRFPKGIRKVSDNAHAKGLKIIVWFEPERVMPGTWLAKEHPDWLLAPSPNPGDQMYAENFRLLNLGNPDALQWLINHIDEFLTRENIDIYREDFNMDPLYFWRANEPEDRQGIVEIKYVTNHLAYWDELLRRNPTLLIDNCASGGKRVDLESMRRSVVFTCSDYSGLLNALQCIRYGIASWIPYYGSLTDVVDQYDFRSYMAPSIGFGIDPRRNDIDLDLWRRLIEQFKQVSKYYFGDYYPLTSYSLENNVWMAWQFDCPEIGEGMVQAFRRENSPCETVRFTLRGLQAEDIYTVRNLDSVEVQHLSGRSLMEEGLFVKISKKPGSVIFTYNREHGYLISNSISTKQEIKRIK